MAKIPWIVYAVVGGGMIYAVEKLQNENLNLFKYVGYVFIIIAVAKLLIWFMLGKKRKTIEPKMKPSDMPREMPKASAVCSYCKAPIPPTGRFCPYCGARIRI